ncbi:putative F-box protein At4g17780 [Apium graveolens]|uniref:putative F-box protein At4g17780 n=1 Tax=Apium graveolens TaxID=4045 RepID=UPI003D78E6B2
MLQPVLVGGKRIRLKRELPEEVIIDEILTRLPIKSVVRFKSVSKSWLSLLSGSHFIQKHKTRSPMQNPIDYDCLVTNKKLHISIVSRNQEIFLLPINAYSLIGSVNGLVCLLRHFKRLSLWNPAIHKSIEFNLPQNKQGGYSYPNLVGVSFDYVSTDYKVVVVYESCAYVYSSISSLWIPLCIPDLKFLVNKFEDIPTTYVKDCPYWTYSTYSSDHDMFVTSAGYCSYGTYPSVKNNFVKSLTALKFDATSNKFKLLAEFFPDARSNERGKIFRFVNMRDVLTLMAHEPSPIGKLDVYSLDEGCGVWIKMYDLGPFERFRRFQFMQQGFKYGDEIVFLEYGKIYYYDHKTDTFKCLQGKNGSRFLNCFTYTPTMVSLQGMKSIYSDNQTRPLGDPMRLITSLKE